MAIKVHATNYTLPVNSKLIIILSHELEKSDVIPFNDTVINFRDPDYSPINGGFHPVEILIDSKGIIQYITDFAYYGSGDMAELDKDIDFDFSSGIFQYMGGIYPIEQGLELFEVCQQNFCAYYEMGVFEVEISTYGN